MLDSVAASGGAASEEVSLGLAENRQKQNNQFLEGGGEDQGGNEAGMMA